jgi:hypothetical protein
MTGLDVLVIVLYFAIALLLIRKYLRTRDAAFIWLSAAVSFWPFCRLLLLRPLGRVLIDRTILGLNNGHPVAFIRSPWSNTGR